jgi:hypothetical protein
MHTRRHERAHAHALDLELTARPRFGESWIMIMSSIFKFDRDRELELLAISITLDRELGSVLARADPRMMFEPDFALCDYDEHARTCTAARARSQMKQLSRVDWCIKSMSTRWQRREGVGMVTCR